MTTQHTADNARLAAAAPELLACLLDVLDADGDLNVMDFDRYRAAIAEECDANIRLIAAAPDLLDACRCALADMEGLEVDGEDSPAFLTIQELKAAIAKATRVQP